MREWNAGVYHRVSNPQLEWGLAVLGRLPLRGDEHVLDLGCGTGRLTKHLLQRLPRGSVIAADQSANMIATAREYLRPHYRHRAFFVLADGKALPFVNAADAIFSTATFHWITDHPRLFASLFLALKPGGRLVAQCGGAGNVDRVLARCAELIRTPALAPAFDTWQAPWEFADASTTRRRLIDQGFADVRTVIEAAPARFEDRAAFREFVEHVVVRPFLARMSRASDRDWFLDALTDQAAADSPPFELDYQRLNIEASKPSAEH
jgi:trans-aconitate 2-methyltransferase